MTLVRYDPWRALSDMRKELDGLFDNPAGWGVDDQSKIGTGQWSPAVDVKEEPNRFVLYVDVPGVDPKDIEVTMEKGTLTVRGERKFERKEEEENFSRVERMYGSFYRRFALPDTADPEGIEAHGKNGVLEILVPKRELAQPRRISIKH